MKVIVRSAEPDGERRRSLQSNTSFVGLRDFLLDGAGRSASVVLYSLITTRTNMEALPRRYLLAPASGLRNNRPRPLRDLQMRCLVMAGLVLAAPSIAMAGSQAVHTSSPTARSVPAARSAEVVFSKSHGQGRTVRERKVLPLW
jgi:hypothetical protein